MAETQTASRWRDLGVRVAAALVLMPAVLLCVWWGGVAYLLLLIAAGVGVAWEWCQMAFGEEADRFQLPVYGLTLIAALLCAAFSPAWYSIVALAAGWLVSIALASRSAPFGFWRAAGLPYLTLPLLALFHLRAEDGFGFLALIWLLMVIWATDTFAYFAGRLIGGPKLSRLSPKKTWAGLGGGAVGAGLASAIVGIIAKLPVIWIPVLLAAIIAVVSQIGDIFESAAKRHFNVKDSSSLIPGHGGILDRIDGLMFAALFCVGLALLRGSDLYNASRFLFW